MGDGKLRVAMFSDSALPILNGVSVSIDLLVRELRNLGHSVHVFTAAHYRYRDPDPNTYRFPAVETPWTKNYPLAIPPFYGMLRAFRRHTFDIVHTHTPYTVGFVGLRWAESHGLPIVATYHTLYDRYAHYIPFFPRRYVRYKIAKHTNFYYNSVDRIVTPSQAAMRWLQRHSVDRPIHVIPTGAPDGPMLDRSEVRKQLHMTPDQRILLYVGRVAPEKNLIVLLEGVALAMANDPSLRLWLVGDGPYRRICVEKARSLGIGDRVHFAGYIPRDQVDRYYAAADLFVFSSITETQGLVVQEAMGYGLPAVAVAGGGAADSIVPGENGFVVANDPRPFGETIIEVLRDEALYSQLCAGAKRTVRAYTGEAMARDVVEVYRLALGAERLQEKAAVGRV